MSHNFSCEDSFYYRTSPWGPLPSLVNCREMQRHQRLVFAPFHSHQDFGIGKGFVLMMMMIASILRAYYMSRAVKNKYFVKIRALRS